MNIEGKIFQQNIIKSNLTIYKKRGYSQESSCIHSRDPRMAHICKLVNMIYHNIIKEAKLRDYLRNRKIS